MSGANPRDADLGSAHLIDVNLNSADLNGANLRDANLGLLNAANADLSRTDLRGANLAAANLGNANLGLANLAGANLSDVVKGSQEQLAQAKSLHDATMPDGQKYEDGLKSEGGGEDKETSGSS